MGAKKSKSASLEGKKTEIPSLNEGKKRREGFFSSVCGCLARCRGGKGRVRKEDQIAMCKHTKKRPQMDIPVNKWGVVGREGV